MISNDEIETVARRICTELGVDPNGEISYGGGDTRIMTPAELEAHQAGGGVTYDVAMIGERWMLYRRDAALAIAVSRVS